MTQISIGRFHHFHLARQMEKFGLLDCVWTGYPRFKLRDELGIPPGKIKTFPWLQTAVMGLDKVPFLGRSPAVRKELTWLAHDTLDRRAALALKQPRILIALSGQGQHSGKRAKALGGYHICDRGSSHIRVQDRLLRDEHARWSLPYAGIDTRTVAKEEAEYDNADLITVPSTFAEHSFLEMGVPASKLRRIPYGGRLDRFRPQGRPAEGAFTVLFVGHISLRKGIPYLLEAFARLNHPNKRLRMVGSIDDSMAPLLATLPQEGVEFLGATPNTELARHYSEADVLVLPSVEEGLAMVMAEAMACGCPVIASRNTGAEDLFTDRQEGFIVPVGSSSAITAALEELAQDPRLAADMRERAVQRIRSIDGWNGYGQHWRDLIEALPAREPALRGALASPHHRTAP